MCLALFYPAVVATLFVFIVSVLRVSYIAASPQLVSFQRRVKTENAELINSGYYFKSILVKDLKAEVEKAK